MDDQYRYTPTEPAPPHRPDGRKWLIAGGVVLAVVALVAGGTVVVTKLSRSNGASQDGTTTTPFNGLTIVPTHPPEPTNFNAWNPVGGIAATFSEDGRTVRLDPAGAPATTWTGLIQPGDPACSLRFTGRVRGASSGYAIGLTTAGSPADPNSGPIPAPADNDWHAIDVTITKTGDVSVDLDGKPALRHTTAPSCGRPAIRVSRGPTEFANVLVGQVAV